MNKTSMFVKNAALVIAGAFLAMTLSDASAANKWYTARTINGRTQPLSAGTQTITMPDGRTVGINSASVSGGLVDLVISLYNNPQGDDNGNTQDVDPASINQDAYEKIIQYFADGVYEATDGAHTIRNVRIYRGGTRSDADVTWEAGPGTPGTWYVNQQGISVSISMYDQFSGHNFPDAASQEPGGYTLAHEFGHYFYGLGDEYCTWDGDTNNWIKWDNLAADEKTQPCIMNYQWGARGRIYTWLNHSIKFDMTSADYVDYECRNKTDQYQSYCDGAWVVLSRNPTNDPQDTAYQQWQRNNHGMRMYYPEVAAKAPTGMNPPKIDLSSATALKDLASRQKLNILWMGSNIVVEIIIDESTSMYDPYSKLTSAKAAAKLLVDQIPDNSAVGVIGFKGSVFTVSGITVVTSATMRATIKAEIDSSYGGDGTAIGDAALEGLIQIQAFGHTNFTRAAFILSDGASNVGSDPLEAAAAYQTDQIPIFTFGFGDISEIDSRLITMAGMTGGTYYYSPNSLAEIAAAFQNAFASVSARQNLADGTFMASGTSAKGAVSIPFQVDSTIADINVTVGYDSSNAVSLNLTDPNGVARPATSTNSSGTDCLLLFTASSPVVGQWKIGGTAASGSSLRYQVNGGVNGFSYYLTPVSRGTNSVGYPNKVEILARLNRGGPSINGAVVTAAITDPQTNTTSVTLTNSADGTYAGVFTATCNGIFNIVVSADNSANTATYTYADIRPSATESGEIGAVPPDAPVNESFTRTAVMQVTVNTAIPLAPYVWVSDGFYPASEGGGGCLDSVKVSWSAMAYAAVYEIWRSTDDDSANAIKIGEVDSPGTTYTDTDVAIQKYYYYWVKASNFMGTSGLRYYDYGSPLFGPDVRINDSKETTVAYGSPVVVTALLRTGSAAGIPCDWWVVAYAETLGAIFYLDGNVQWQQAFGGFADVRPIYQGPLFDLPTPYTVFSWNGLPAGIWRFYFGLDTTVNGYLDPDVTYYRMSWLNIQ